MKQIQRNIVLGILVLLVFTAGVYAILKYNQPEQAETPAVNYMIRGTVTSVLGNEIYFTSDDNRELIAVRDENTEFQELRKEANGDQTLSDGRSTPIIPGSEILVETPTDPQTGTSLSAKNIIIFTGLVF